MSSLILHLLEESDQSFARQDGSFIVTNALPICFPAAAFFSAPSATGLSHHAIAQPIEDMYDLKERLRWQDVSLPSQPSTLPDDSYGPLPAALLW